MEWISVKERLPEDSEEYLTIDKWKIIDIEHFFQFDNDFHRHNITHWMTLPEPPKE